MRRELGFSSLGLPFFGADALPQGRILDALFGDRLYDLLELHISQRLDESVGAVIPAEVRRAFREIAEGAAERGGRVVLGVGGRFLLGPKKHEPSLIDPLPEGRAARLRLLRESIDLAADIGARVLVFLGGPSDEALLPGKHQGEAWKRFEDGIGSLVAHAEARDVVLAPEAHSKHIFATVNDVRRLKATFPSKSVGFTADVVHQSIAEDEPLDRVLQELAPLATHVQLDNVTRETCVRGAEIVHTLVHEPGAVDFPSALRALYERGGYRGPVSVEFLREDFAGIDALAYCRDVGAWLRALLEAYAETRPSPTLTVSS